MASLRHPPLLLTKRLTSFLHLNLSPQITTLLLLTPDGKLLAYASQPPIPVATLRTHGTVAASLYAIHSNGTDLDSIDGALPPGSRGSTPASATRGRRRSTTADPTAAATAAAGTGGGPLAVTIQLESGTVLVIRRLKCGMLFVSMGPPAAGGNPHPHSRPGTQHAHHHQQQHPPSGDGGDAAAANGHHTPASASPPHPPAQQQQQQLHPGVLGSPRDTASILSGATGATAQTQTTDSSVVFGAGTAGVVAARRHAEELARWLDDKLGTLEVPDDGLCGFV